VIVGVVGVVLVILGGIAVASTSDSAITDTHSETLKRTLATVENCIGAGIACDYGNEPQDVLGRDSFRRHFKQLKLDRRWEPIVRAYADAVAEHHDRTLDEAVSRLSSSPFETTGIGEAIHRRVVERAQSGGLGPDLGLQWRSSPMTGWMSPKGDRSEAWVKLEHLPDEDLQVWFDRGEDLRAEVDRLGADALLWPETHAVVAASQRVDGRKHELLGELRLIRQKWPPAVAWRCPGC
jgi:hypothetical protein